MVKARQVSQAALSLVAAVTVLAGCSQIDPNDPSAYPATPSAAPSTSVAPTPEKQTPKPATPSAAVSNGNGTVTCNYPAFGAPVRPVKIPTANDVPATGTVTFRVHLGEQTVTITSDRAAAPCSVHSLESLAQQSYFDGTACHRLVTTGPYLLQCGDPSGTGRGGPGYVSGDELRGSEKYPAGTVALANPGTPDRNGSQFFMVYADSEIPASYTVVGTLDAASLDVLRQVVAPGDDGSDPNGGGKPRTDIVITTFEVQP